MFFLPTIALYLSILYTRRMQILLTLLLSFLLGIGCSRLALKRGRHPTVWFAAGLLFGIFALIVLYLLPPPKRQKEAPEEVIIAPSPQLPLHTPEHASRLWYFLDEQKAQLGPMSFEALSRAWHEGKVHEKTFVWNEEMDNWKRLQEVIKLNN